MDPDPDPSIIMQNLDSYYFVTLFDFLPLKMMELYGTFKRVISRKNCLKN
jgi:hypothetical protein